MRHPLRWLSAHYVHHRWFALAVLLVIAAVLQVGGAVGLAYWAGFDAVRHVMAGVEWPWLVAVVAATVVSFVGYYFAYRGIFAVRGGPDLHPRQMRAVVAAGFGGFLAHGGGALDKFALQGAGTDEHDADVRVTGLAGLEHGILALGGCGAAIAVLLEGLSKPPLDFTLPWAVVPVPGFLIAFWAARRYRRRLDPEHGWQAKLRVFLDAIDHIRTMFVTPSKYGVALLGMALFWVADALAAWGALAAFGFLMNVATFIVAYGTGMVFTRRTGPLGGAGVLVVALSLTIWYSGAPFAPAVAGIFAYRVLTLWLPMPFSLAALPTLRALGDPETPHAEGEAYAPNEPALRRRGAGSPG
jgi:uncharacterized membrane protein YbhN (UPF0104 family)